MFLEDNKMLPEKQKGCRNDRMGTNNLLFVDKMVYREVEYRKKNLSMAWIDYRKGYAIISHS